MLTSQTIKYVFSDSDKLSSISCAISVTDGHITDAIIEIDGGNRTLPINSRQLNIFLDFITQLKDELHVLNLL